MSSTANQDLHVEQCLEKYTHKFQPNLFRGKVVFITGGGSGICFTIAELFMRHGCDVAIAGRKLNRLQQSAQTLSKCTGRRCLPVQMDVRKPQEIMAGMDQCLSAFGRLDVLVNGAAGNFLCPLESMSFNAFKTVIEIDTLGTFNCSKVAHDKYFKDHGGVIINLTATLHLKGALLQAHVGPAKAAIEYLTRHQAVEWGPKAIRSVCLAPGPIGDTEGMRRLGGGRSFEEVSQNIPAQRIGTRQEMAEICLFLASDMASYITGTSVIADGGSWLTSGNSYEFLDAFRAMSKM